MRDIGILVWVALLIVGVVGSMTSRIRSLRQTQAQRAPQRMQPAQRAQPFISPVAQPAAPTRQAPTRQAPARQATARPVPARQPAPSSSRIGQDSDQAVKPGAPTAAKRLFGDRRDLVRAVIAAEVLGKPRAFGDEYTWG